MKNSAQLENKQDARHSNRAASGRVARRQAAGTTTTGPETGAVSSITNLRQVISEIVDLMIRKRIIEDHEGKALLR